MITAAVRPPCNPPPRPASTGGWRLRGPTAALVARYVDLYTDGEPEVLRRDFGASLHAAFTVSEVQSQLRQAGLAGLSVQAVSDRHLTVVGVL